MGRMDSVRPAPVEAHPGAFFPAIADAYGRIFEIDHELVEVGLILRPRRVLQPVRD